MRQSLFILLLCTLSTPCQLFAQAKINVDSLATALAQYPEEDTVKVNMLLNLVREYQHHDTKKAMEYADLSVKISEQLGDDYWIGQAYKNKSVVYYITGDLKSAQTLCQKGVSLLEKDNKHPNDLAGGIMILGSIVLSNGDVAAALRHYESALAIFERTQNVKKQISTIVGIGNCYSRMGNLEKALELYKEGLKKSEQSNNMYNLSLLYSNIAAIYGRMGNYALSLDQSLKAVDILKQLNDLYGLAKEYNNISGVYYKLNDKEETKKYLLKALELHHKLNDRFGIAHTTINISLTYEDDHKAIAELKKALEYCKEVNNKYLLGLAVQNLISRLINVHDYTAAYTYAQEGFEIEQQGKNTENITSLNLNCTEILIKCSDDDLHSFGIAPNKRYEKAKEYLDKVLALGNNANLTQTAYAWRDLSLIQEKEQNYAQAYESYKKYIAIKDSISGDDIKKQITRKEIQYEFDKKETELKYQQKLTADELEKQRLLSVQQEQALALNQQNLRLKEQALALSNKEKDLAHLAYLKEQAEKQEKEQELILSQEREKGKERDLNLKNLELSTQQKQNIYLIAFATLLLAGLGALLYFYTALKKQKNIITQQNEVNEHTIAILSHDIKAPLMGVKLMLKKLNKDDPFIAQASQSLEDQINAVNGILNNLLRMKKMALTKRDKNPTANVNTVLQNVLQELHIAIQGKGLSIQNELKDDMIFPIESEKLQIVIHNLLSNAVKYSFPQQTIRIFHEGRGIAIQDFGVGLSPEYRSKLMREVTASQTGTQMERGNGLGLFLVGALLQGEAIRVVFDSPDVGGTIVRILQGQ